MAYLGIMLALIYVKIGFQIAIQPRPAGSVVYRNLFEVVAMGLIYGLSLLISTVGLFVLMGASLPAVQIMWVIMIASAVEMTLYYWNPVVDAINRYHGIATRQFIVV